MRSGGGANRQVIRACLKGEVEPVMGEALFWEYRDVLGRSDIFARSPLTMDERQELFDAFLSVAEWVQVHFGWRPNLRDEGDNHLIQLAVAAGASVIVTHNISDLKSGELLFPSIEVLTPGELLRKLRT